MAAMCSYDIEVVDYVASLKKKYGVDNLKDLQKKLPGKGKQFKLNYLEVTTGDLKTSYKELFTEDGKVFDEAQKKLTNFVSSRNDVGNKVSRLLDITSEEIDTAMLSFRKYFNTNITDEKNKLSEDEIIASSIALKYILDSMDNEEALADAYNVKATDVVDKDIQGLSTGLTRLYPTIGRAILASKGFVTSGDPRKSAVSAAVVGMAAVKTLANKTNIISINPQGKWITGSGVIKESNNSTRGRRSLTAIGPTVLLNEEFNNKENIHALSPEAASMLAVLKQASRLVEPQTEALPTREASEYEASIQDLQSMGEELKESVTTANSFKFKINSNVKAMLDVLKKDFEKTKENSSSASKSFKKYIEEKFKGLPPEIIKAIFGINLDKDADGALFVDSNLGVELSQTSPMEGLMENYDSLIDDNPLFFNYFVAVNSRLNVFETVLNFQSDKKFARQVLVSNKPTKYSATKTDPSYDTLTEKEVLIRRVAVEFKIPTSFITDPAANKDLTDLVEAFADFEDATVDGIISVLRGIAEISNGAIPELKSLKGMSPWKIIKLISAIKDIRSGDGDIESTYMAEVDATASGLLIMLLQNAGNKLVQGMLKRLGFKGAAEVIEGQLRDAYGIAVEALSSEIKTFEDANNGPSKSKYNLKKVTGLSETSQLLSALELNVRELIKIPIVTFIYGQTAKNNQIQLAKDLFKIVNALDKKTDTEQITKIFKIYDMNDVDINDFLNPNKNTNVEVLKNIRAKFIENVATTTGNYLVTGILEKVYTVPFFKQRNDDIETLYGLIESSNSLVSINSPYSVISSKEKLDTLKNKDKIPLSKSKETLITEKVNDVFVTTIAKLRASNPTSARVVPIHTIDATVLSRTMNRLKKELGGDFTENEAIMLVHDAALTNSKLASRFSTIYEEELIEVNKEYDVVNELINEYLSKEGSDRSKIQDIITRNEENLAAKQAFLSISNNIPYSFRTNLSDDKIVNSEVDTDTDTDTDINTDPSDGPSDGPNGVQTTTSKKSSKQSDAAKFFKVKVDNAHTALGDINTLKGITIAMTADIKKSEEITDSAADGHLKVRAGNEKTNTELSTMKDKGFDPESADTIYLDFETAAKPGIAVNANTAIPYEVAYINGDGSVKGVLYFGDNKENVLDFQGDTVIEGLRSSSDIEALYEGNEDNTKSTEVITGILQGLLKGKTVVTYNGNSFDNIILEGIIGVESYNKVKTLDIFPIFKDVYNIKGKVLVSEATSKKSLDTIINGAARGTKLIEVTDDITNTCQ